jgi:hypothetical protein
MRARLSPSVVALGLLSLAAVPGGCEGWPRSGVTYKRVVLGEAGGAPSGGQPLDGGGSSAAGTAPTPTGDHSWGGQVPSTDITLENAWVPLDEGGSGIQGAFIILEDRMKNHVALGGAHSSFTADSSGDQDQYGAHIFTDESQTVCVSGVAARRLTEFGEPCDDNYDESEPGTGPECSPERYWGGGIGLNLNQEEGGAQPSTWDADSPSHRRVTGFTFTVSGSLGGAGLRFVGKVGDEAEIDYCVQLEVRDPLEETAVSVRLDELLRDCWKGPGARVKSDELVRLDWQIVTDSADLHRVTSFCVTSLAWF